MSLVGEVRRRNVHRMAGLYLVASWLVVQVSSTILPVFEAPAWILRTLIVVLAGCFVPALVFSWVFQITPEGLKRETGLVRSAQATMQTDRRADRLLLLALAVAIAYFAFDKFVLAPYRTAAQAEAARSEGRAEGLVRSYGDKSIAVLPFADLSPAHDQAYFSDGIAEEVLNLLAGVSELRVISRASAFSFKDKSLAIPEIAQKLNVAHVLQGAVRKSGDRVRITAQLVDARADTQLWSQSWDRQLDDVFAVQDEIAASVVEELRLKLLGAVPSSQRIDRNAYQLFLQAREISNRGAADDYRQATELCEQALRLAPDYAPAWTLLALNEFRSVNVGLVAREPGFAKARAAVDRAIAIDPRYAPAYAMSGWLWMYGDNDLERTAHDLGRALQLAPMNGVVLGRAAALLYNLGRVDEAIALGRYEISHDPLYVPAYVNQGARYMRAHRFDDAVTSFRTMLRLSPDKRGGQALYAQALLLGGNAVAALEAVRLEKEDGERLYTLATIEHALGHRAESDRALGTMINRHGDESPLEVGYAFAFRGEVDRAFEWLAKAERIQEPGLAENILYPYFEKLHGDPRWIALLRRLGRAPEQIAKLRFNVVLPGSRTDREQEVLDLEVDR